MKREVVLSCLCVLMMTSGSVMASDTYRMPEIQVVGKEKDLKNIPGSATIITKEELEEIQPVDTNELLKTVPGVSVRDEDGLGLRPNISLRGIPGDRSRKVLLLEDGVPISLAPYGENSAYYSPEVDRISRIEVRKGSSSILFGPQTIGGVVNYMTPNPPESTEKKLKVEYGSQNYKSALYSYGTRYNDTGVYVSLLHKQGDGPRDPMPFMISDFTGKLVTKLSDRSEIMLKAHYYNEDSKTTYTGLTTAEYNDDHTRNMADKDSLYVERAGVSAVHQLDLAEDTQLKTVVYAYTTRRDWWRQDKVSTLDSKGYTQFEDENGGRNRVYKVAGIEPRLEKGNFNGGAKFHYEEERNTRVNGDSALARTGTLSSDEKRSTTAQALFGEYKFEISPKFAVIPGLRIEAFNQKRDAAKTGVQLEWIPGIGLTYDVSKRTNVYAGVHRGFAPPRFSDAIDKNGVDQKLEAEKSWNYEAGVRTRLARWLTTEATVFYNDYENQVMNASDSSGYTKANTGKTTSKGLELNALANYKIWELKTALTYTDAKFDTDLVEKGGSTTKVKGNKIPYVPEGTASVVLGVNLPNGINGNIEGLYISKQFSDASNTVAADASGAKKGEIPAYTVLNLNTSYMMNPSTKLYLSVKNVLDKKYIASRNPEGIFPGSPRHIRFGLKKTF